MRTCCRSCLLSVSIYPSCDQEGERSPRTAGGSRPIVSAAAVRVGVASSAKASAVVVVRLRATGLVAEAAMYQHLRPWWHVDGLNLPSAACSAAAVVCAADVRVGVSAAAEVGIRAVKARRASAGSLVAVACTGLHARAIVRRLFVC